MNKLKVIQQRVFCIFFRPYQRTTGKSPNKLVELELSMMHWNDPTINITSETTGCPNIRRFMPIGPSNLAEDGESTLTAITDPPSTRQLKYQQRALQFYKFDTDNLEEEPSGPQPFISTTSKNMQPFNEDRMFTEDLWLISYFNQ